MKGYDFHKVLQSMLKLERHKYFIDHCVLKNHNCVELSITTVLIHIAKIKLTFIAKLKHFTCTSKYIANFG